MDQHRADHTSHHDDDDDDTALAELLDLDGQVLHAYWTDVLTWVGQAWVGHAAEGVERTRILDLGAGTGTGTIGLAQRCTGAEIVAVDVSEAMLRRIRAKALDLGLGRRISTVQADLNHAWPDLGPVDLTWASMSLHHLADPDRVLGDVFATTRPGGLLAVAELTEPLRFLPHDVGLGRPGLEQRCLDALDTEHARSVPELGSDWATRLATAGFTTQTERTFTIDLSSPYPPGAASYARLWLQRMTSGVAERLARDDLDALATLIDGDGPESLQQREDLRLRGARTVTLARRP